MLSPFHLATKNSLKLMQWQVHPGLHSRGRCTRGFNFHQGKYSTTNPSLIVLGFCRPD